MGWDLTAYRWATKRWLIPGFSQCVIAVRPWYQSFRYLVSPPLPIEPRRGKRCVVYLAPLRPPYLAPVGNGRNRGQLVSLAHLGPCLHGILAGLMAGIERVKHRPQVGLGIGLGQGDDVHGN